MGGGGEWFLHWLPSPTGGACPHRVTPYSPEVQLHACQMGAVVPQQHEEAGEKAHVVSVRWALFSCTHA